MSGPSSVYVPPARRCILEHAARRREVSLPQIDSQGEARLWMDAVDAAQTAAELDAFLEHYTPSRWTRDDVDWICVRRMNSAVTEREEDTGPLVMLKRHLTGGGTTTSEAVLECARATKLLSGKWLIASHPNMVDAAWDKVVRALADGKLGFAAKVSPRTPTGNYKFQCNHSFHYGTHLICVYTSDWTDDQEVMRVREGLRELGFCKPLCYKPDIYTLLGVDAKSVHRLGLERTYIFKA